MKYTLQPSGTIDIFDNWNATMYSIDEYGNETESGTYKNPLFPDGYRSYKVKWLREKRQYDIKLSNKELSALVKEMRFVDKETKKIITEADKYNEFDPFFTHDDLKLQAPNGGISLDTETAWGKFWFSVLEEDHKVVDVDGKTDNSLVKKIQDFKLMTAGKTKTEQSEQIMEGMKATSYFERIKDNFKQLVDFCRAMDILADENSNIEVMRETIYRKITIDKDQKNRTGVRNIEKFISLYERPITEVGGIAKIVEAYKFKILDRRRATFIYDGVEIGRTAEEAWTNLQRDSNKAIYEEIMEKIKNHDKVKAGEEERNVKPGSGSKKKIETKAENEGEVKNERSEDKSESQNDKEKGSAEEEFEF